LFILFSVVYHTPEVFILLKWSDFIKKMLHFIKQILIAKILTHGLVVCSLHGKDLLRLL